MQILGRDRELARLDVAIGPGGDGRRIVLVTGPAGSGMTTVVQCAAERARARGFEVVSVRGRAASRSTTFAPLIESVPGFGARLAQLRPEHRQDTDRAAAALVASLVELGAASPFVLVVDDPHLLDESSIALLPFVTDLDEQTDISVVLTHQLDAIASPASFTNVLADMLDRHVVARVELGPLADEAIRGLAARELGCEPGDVPDTVVARAAGNPWFASELVRTWRAGSQQVPTSIATAASTRLHALDELSRDLIRATALCDGAAHVGWLEQICDRSPKSFERSCAEIVASGLVVRDGEHLSIAHPLVRRALIDDTSPAMRRAMHLELADAVLQVEHTEVERARVRGEHLLAAGRTAPAVALFVRAADLNEAQGNLPETYVDLARAVAVEVDGERRGELLCRCATIATQVDRRRAQQYWAELGRIASSRGDDETYAYALFQQYWTANDGKARDRLARAASLGADRYGWAARAAANIASLDGDVALAERHDRRALELARATGDGVLEAMALMRLGVAVSLQGRHAEAIDILQAAVEHTVEHRQHAWAVAAWGELGECLANDMRMSEALEATAAAIRYVDERELDRMRPAALAWHASCLRQAGSLVEARDTIEAAALQTLHSGADQYSPLVALLTVEVLNELGDSRVGEQIATTIALVDQLGYASWREQLRVNEARAEGRRSMPRALELLRELDAEDEPSMLAEAATWLVRTSVLLDHAAGLELGRTMQSQLRDDQGGRYVELVRRELDATFAALATSEVRTLELIAEEWFTGGRMLDALRVLAVAGAIELQTGRVDEGMCKLREARAGFAERGASPDADVVAALLRGAGAGSRARTSTSTVGNLTAREVEVARLIASGMRNADAAEQLHVTRRTVTEHLSNIYAKLGLASRVQLTAWMASNDLDTAIRSNGGSVPRGVIAGEPGRTTVA